MFRFRTIRSVSPIVSLTRRYIHVSSRLSDYYSILGGSKEESTKDLKKKFRKKAKEFHPDSSSTGDTEKFQQINEAWEVLKDGEQRKMYDQLGHEGYKRYKETGGVSYESAGNPFDGMDINDLFSDLFGGGRASQRRRQRGRQRVPGNDLNVALELSFEEAVNGATKSFTYYRMDKCSDCKGSGVRNNEKADENNCQECNGQGVKHRMVGNNMFTQETCRKCHGVGQILRNGCASCGATGQTRKKTEITDFVIPPGVDTGTVFQKPNGGDAGLFGGHFGDLVLQVTVKPDRTGKFTRTGLDLFTNVRVGLVKSLIGGNCEIKSVTGDILDMKIAPGTLHGSMLRLPLRGVHYGSRKGDMFVKVQVESVKNLTARQKELLEEFEVEEEKKKKQQMGNMQEN